MRRTKQHLWNNVTPTHSSQMPSPKHPRLLRPSMISSLLISLCSSLSWEHHTKIPTFLRLKEAQTQSRRLRRHPRKMWSSATLTHLNQGWPTLSKGKTLKKDNKIHSTPVFSQLLSKTRLVELNSVVTRSVPEACSALKRWITIKVQWTQWSLRVWRRRSPTNRSQRKSKWWRSSTVKQRRSTICRRTNAMET